MRSLDTLLRDLGLEHLGPVFAKNEVDLDALALLSEQDLADLGIALRPRRKLLKAVGELHSGGRAVQSAAATAGPGSGERRQLTVMFCDLADSTTLAAQLDPEQLRELIRAYQESCTAIVRRFEGHVAQYLGDGVLVYFGHPRAHEDDAQRAVYAALELVSAMRELSGRQAAKLPVALSVRIGIDTGLVVVGSVGDRDEQLAMGETPNVAARLQGAAPANGIVISAATRRLVQGLFSMRELGLLSLKGLAQPVPGYEILAKGDAQNRIEAASYSGLTPLVSRDLEVGLLLDRWERTCDGQGQVVLLVGEPGIGKSRMVQVLRERLAGNRTLMIEHRCSPYYRNSPLYPVIEMLPRAFGWTRDDIEAVRRDKLHDTLARFDNADPESAALLAALLSLPGDARFVLPVMSPERQRQRTLETLLGWVQRIAGRQPVLYVVEDLHWIDPTTLELLTLLVNQAPGSRMMLLLTARPDFESPWSGRSHLTPITLGRLTRRQAVQMAVKVAGGKPLPTQVVDHIVARTDGVPLFVEELTKMLLESERLREDDGRYVLDGPLMESAIPSTLQDSLTARLDRLGSAKEIAQLAATLGRTFDFEMLKAVTTRPGEDLAEQLRELVEAEILIQRGMPPQASYSFKHTLIQEAAYQTLLKSVRQDYHRRVAQALEMRLPGGTAARAELLAHHLNEAGDVLEAAAQWLTAGEHASEGRAYEEARGHLNAGLRALAAAPPGIARDRLEARLQIALGTVYFQSLFYTAPEVGRCFQRALELSADIGDAELTAMAVFGLWVYEGVRGELDTATQLYQRMLVLTAGTPLLPYAHLLTGCTQFWLGNVSEARRHLETGLRLFEAEDSRTAPYWLGHHVAVSARVWLGMSLWTLGYPDAALEVETEGVSKAKSIANSYSEAFVSMHLAYVQNLRREHEAARATASHCVSLAVEQGYPNWALLASIHEAQAMAVLGERARGIPLQQQRIAELIRAGDNLGVPYFQGRLAESLADELKFDEAVRLVDDSMQRIARNSGHWCCSYLFKTKGDILLKLPQPDERQAESLYLQAIDVARKQQARSFELQAALSLARLWRRTGKPNEAREILRGIYDQFTEGFDTPDLKDAKEMIATLSHR